MISISHWISLAVATSFGVILGYVVGKHSEKKKTCIATKEKPEASEKDEVLFFPDSQTYAGDADLSRAVKGGLLCKEILDHSVPLLRLVEHILSAKVSIDLCLYMLTQHKLGKAVIQKLKKTNIRVRFIVNESSSKLKDSFVGELQKNGAFVRMKKSDYLMHHKFAIIDGKKLISGSFNWTMQAAMGNYENVIITSNPFLVQSFVDEFEKLWTTMARE